MEDWEKTSEKGRVERCAESFRRLAEVFQYLPAQKEALCEEDLEEIYEGAREQVCAQCGRYVQCWRREPETTVQMAYDLLTAVEGGAGAAKEDNAFYQSVRSRFFRYCIRANSFMEELRNGFSRARLNMMWSNRMLENRAAMAEQLQETAQIIQEIACTVFDEGEADTILERKVKMRLRLHGVRLRSLRLRKNTLQRPEMIVTAQAARGRCVCLTVIAKTLSEVCGRSYVPERNSRLTLGQEPTTMHFVEETGYYMLTGTARKTCAGQASSGDNFAVLMGSHGQAILGISDGMGSGMRANRESQTVIELMEQFLEAGFSAETAVRMINSAMVLRRGMEQFSTLDICGINLYTGQCEFLKIGAATTFIRRAGWVETVVSTSLPVGILREADFEQSKKCLEHGDMIVMVSDGIIDALPETDGEELMKYLLLHITEENPAAFAQKLLDQVLTFADNLAADDMTILAGGFWKK